jgi:hypothetical protein
MKKLVLLLALLLPALALAASNYDEIQEKLDLKRGVKFGHKLHFETMGFACTFCHETMSGGKITGFGKNWAHAKCLGCHNNLKHAPKKCVQCHIDYWEYK